MVVLEFCVIYCIYSTINGSTQAGSSKKTLSPTRGGYADVPSLSSLPYSNLVVPSTMAQEQIFRIQHIFTLNDTSSSK